MLLLGAVNLYLAWQKRIQPIKPNSLTQPSIPPLVSQYKLTYQYVGELPQLAKNVPVYQIADSFFTAEKAVQLASDFGFKQTPEILDDNGNKIYFFSQDNLSLTISTNPTRVEYGNYQEPSGTILPQQEVTSLVNSFIQKANIFGKSQIGYKLSYTRPLQVTPSSEKMIETDYEKANYLELTYNLLLNTYPVIPKDLQTDAIAILANKDGSIRKATITIVSQQVSIIGNATLAEPEAALQAMNAGGGIIATFNNPKQTYTQIDARTISSAQLRSLELVYLYDYDLKTLQPYYRFSGSAVTSNKDQINLSVLITALPQDLYKK